MATSPTAEATQRFVEALQNDFRILSTESKKKFPQLKESCEEAIIVLKNASSSNQSLYYIVNQVLYPVIQGCETKDQKIIKVSATPIHQLVIIFVLLLFVFVFVVLSWSDATSNHPASDRSKRCAVHY